MPRIARPHRLLVKLTEREHAVLVARARDEGVAMADVLRAGIDSAVPARVPSRERALEVLAEAAEDGSWQAAMALARELRLGKPADVAADEFAAFDELASKRRAARA